MDTIWKTLTAPIIAAVVAGYALAQLQAPEAPTLHANVTWVDIPNPVRTNDPKVRTELSRAGQAALGSNDLEALLNWSQFTSTVRLAVLRIENNATLRSKDFEVYLPEREGVILTTSNRVDNQGSNSKTRVALKPLDPGASVRVTVVAQPWSEYLPFPIGLLHDGKRMHIANHTATGTSAILLDLIDRYPVISSVVAVLLATTGILLLLFVPLAVALDRSKELRLKLTTKSDLIKLAHFVDWVRKEHPEAFGNKGDSPAARQKSADNAPAE